MKPTSTDLDGGPSRSEALCFGFLILALTSRGGLTPKELSPFLSATTLLFMLSCGMFTTTNKSFSCNSCCGGHRGGVRPTGINFNSGSPPHPSSSRKIQSQRQTPAHDFLAKTPHLILFCDD
ncbi:unnamed protein product [Prunus armeniaca]|uniref:Uncharacterized protein n=1 Tax=Prunus armeniaca TaxID=36596 RepID=A0A6J5WP87_PRUAR|nr:unnamed protein product [Prunus armeniaca]